MASNEKEKFEKESPSHLDGTVLADCKPFNIEDELKRCGGINVLVPGPEEKSIIRQRLDEGLECAFNCAANVHMTAMYAFQGLSLFCKKDTVALPGHAKYFRNRSSEYLKDFKRINSFTIARGGEVDLREILAPPMPTLSERGENGLTVMEFSLSLNKLVYEKQLHLLRAAENVGDGGAAQFVTEKLIRPMVKRIKKKGMYISMLRRMGKGVGEYTFDQNLLHAGASGKLSSEEEDGLVGRMGKASLGFKHHARGGF